MYARLNGPLLANDATLDLPTHIQYFPLSLKLARSLVKAHPYLTAAQLSNQCLLLGLKAPAIHRLQWLCPCWDTDAAVISRLYQLLNYNGFLREEATGFLTHM